MDERRVQAYIELIQALLDCPGRQEAALLEQYRDLVDGGLVQVMGAVAAQMRQGGNEKAADWLENMAGQIAQVLGRRAQGPGDLDEILEALRQPVRDVRQMGQRVALCRRALALVSRQGNEQLWAALQNELGNSLQQNPLGDRAENIEAAISTYEQSLQIFFPEALPDLKPQNLRLVVLSACETAIPGTELADADLAVTNAVRQFSPDTPQPLQPH